MGSSRDDTRYSVLRTFTPEEPYALLDCLPKDPEGPAQTTGEELESLRTSLQEGVDVSFFLTGERAKESTIIRIWAVHNSEFVEIRKLEEINSRDIIVNLCVLPEGRCAALQESGNIVIHDMNTGRILQQFKPFEKQGSSLTILPGGRLVASGDIWHVFIWNTENFALLHAIEFGNFVGVQTTLALSNGALAVGTTNGLFIYRDDNFLDVYQIVDLSSSYEIGIEVSPGILAFATKREILVCNIESEQVLKVTHPKLFCPDQIIKLQNGNLVTACNKIFIISLTSQRWNNFYRLLFLGSQDEGSDLYGIPKEVLYHFLCITFNNLALQGIQEF